MLSVPDTVSFGTVVVGQTATIAVPVVNTSLTSIQINQIEVHGHAFSLDSAINFPVALAAGSTLQLNVQFDPTASGQATGQLIVTAASQSPGSTIVKLHGLGAAKKDPSLTALSCASATLAGAAADSCTVAISSAAQGSGVGVSLASSNTADLAVPPTVTIPVGATTASFTANAAAVTQPQAVTLSASLSGSSASFDIQLQPPAAVTSSALNANASSISFGNVPVNTLSTQSLTLAASGSVPVTISAISASGAGFSASPGSLPVTLAPGQSVSIAVSFTPTSASADSGILAINSNATADSTLQIPLSGTGTQYSVMLNWDAPTSTTDPVAAYHVYRSPASAGAWQFISSIASPSTSYHDAAVQSGSSYDYIVKSVDTAGVESSPSNTTTAVIP